MANESEVIQHQMEETRTALQDKLETLEQQVKNTVQDATEAVSDTVATVKDAVQDTVETVKDTVHDTVETVKDTFDMTGHVKAHPWPMFLGATAIGFAAGRWVMRDTSMSKTLASASAPAAPAASTAPAVTYHNGTGGNGFTPTSQPETSAAPPTKHWWSSVAEQYSDEIAKVKGLALGTIGGMIREMLTSSAPPALAEQIKEVVDSTTVKLGGHVVEGSILTPSGSATSSTPQTSSEESRYALNMGRQSRAAI